MNQDQLVNKIITEVKRVLEQRGITVTPESQKPAAAPAAPAPQPATSRPAVQAPQTSDIGGTDLTGKQVIVQKDLEPHKGKTIIVTQRAVISPLAMDYAKANGITISRSSAQPSPAQSDRAEYSGIVGVCIAPDFPGDASILKSILATKRLQIKEFIGNSYEDSIKKLCNAVSSGSVHFGVCLEKTGMEGPITANRNDKIRAVHCRETLDSRSARVDYGANVVILDAASNPEAVISGFTGLS